MAAHILLSPVGQKTETRFNCFLTENRKSAKMVGTPSTVSGLLPPPTGRSPSLKEGGLGFRRSRPSALPSIAYRGFAVAPMTLRAPSRNLIYNPGCRVATLLVSMGVMGFLGDLRGRNSKSPPNPLGLAERGLAAHFTYFIFNSARSVNVPAFFRREHPPRTQEI